MRNEKILLVDDEPDVIEILGYNLEKEGYQIISASNGADAIKLALKELPDLIIIDVMMPVMDGMETCYQIRNIPKLQNTLITFLSARNEDYSQIAGFDAGADDYFTKPIKPRLLIKKIDALLKRNASETNTVESNIEVGDFKIDREKYQITKNDVVLHLPKKEFELLALLMKNPGKVYTRESIMNNIWEDSVLVGDRTIDVHIRKLREKIGDDYIKTVKGVGYKFEV